MNIDTKYLLESAKEILKKNWNGKFTIPSPTLYPHQWSWDSCFIAIGKSYFNTEHAIKEIESLFSAQWKNGMIPHIVFDESKKTYFPSAEFYDTRRRTENSPKGVATSGLTHPPVESITCYYIYHNAQDKTKAKEFLREAFPKLMSFHNYLMTYRDPENSGLATILHPWESGLDNSPIWDDALSRIKIEKDDLTKYQRKDIDAVGGAAEVRPSDWMYDRFIYLIEMMKKYGYDERKIYNATPFKIKDIAFNSILFVSNKFLVKIGEILEESADIHKIKNWILNSQKNFYMYFFPTFQEQHKTRKMGSSEEDLFYDYDLAKKDWIKRKTVSSLLPIYTGFISKEDAEVILSWITHAHFCGENSYCHVATVPSTDLETSYFKPTTYWRGPVWINTNWLIWLGVMKYGFDEEADRIKSGVFELASNHGFREFYDPYNGHGLGGKNFSWTAALVIDMIINRGIGIPPD